ncbi:MAG: beta-propeller fold lactonase family protein [Candidatus Sulfotelmatobacter sp.]|jgi:6-phosphogluconolactonase (cycloisomerase 2 family)
MTMQVRTLFTLTVTLAILGLAGCDRYNCATAAQLGSSTCSTGSSTVSSSGGGGSGTNSGPLAFIEFAETSAVPNQMSGVEFTAADVLEPIPSFPSTTLPDSTLDPSALAVAQGKFLYMADGSAQKMFAYSIDANTGIISALSGSPFAASYLAGLPMANVPLLSMVTNPTGTVLLIADQTNSLIYSFTIDATTGALTAATGSPFPSLIKPSNLATDGLGRFLYVTQGDINGQGQSMAVFSLDGTTGSLTDGAQMALNMWTVVGDPAGKFMFGADGEVGTKPPSNALDEHLYTFSINANTGVLTQVASTVTVNAPTAAIVHPTGSFVYVFGIDPSLNFDAPVEGFALNDTTGALTALQGSPFSVFGTNPYDGQLDPTGAYLFVHSNDVFEVSILNTTTGVPGQAFSPLQVPSNLPWVVIDP